MMYLTLISTRRAFLMEFIEREHATKLIFCHPESLKKHLPVRFSYYLIYHLLHHCQVIRVRITSCPTYSNFTIFLFRYWRYPQVLVEIIRNNKYGWVIRIIFP